MSDFLVPDLGEGLEDATITSWAVAVGDVVELNQTLCTVETNKAEVEIPSPYTGRIAELGGAEGETLAVGTLLVRIETEDRAPVLVGYGIDDGMDRSRRARAAPKTRKLAADLAVDLNGLAPGSGTDGVITRDDVLGAAGAASSQNIPVRGVHARMATHMSLSRSRIPDAHASVQVDGTALLRLRDQLDVTPFVLTLRLLVIALGRHPILNATWVEAEGDRRSGCIPTSGWVSRWPPNAAWWFRSSTRADVPPDAWLRTSTTSSGAPGGHVGAQPAERVDVHGVELRCAGPG